MPSTPHDTTRFINPAQIGGVESYTFSDGPARNSRCLCVNTGAGLRYRVLVDRGLDIDQASFDHHSLTFLTHQGASAPTRALDKGADWLQGFPGGLLTTCGPTNIGAPTTDPNAPRPSVSSEGAQHDAFPATNLGLHGPHSQTPAEVEILRRPDPGAGQLDIVIAGTLRYGAFYGPNLTCRRTLRSRLGQNRIDITDEITNAGNTETPHAWLLHINFGYPLLNPGAEFCYDAKRIEPMGNHAPSAAYFAAAAPKRTPAGHRPMDRRRSAPGSGLPHYKRVPAPSDEWFSDHSVVAYLYPKPTDRQGNTTVALVNPQFKFAVAVHYNTRQFPRCAHWQHFGPREYVAALEPASGSVEGRHVDRQRRWLEFLPPGATKTYQYAIEVITAPDALARLRSLNDPR